MTKKALVLFAEGFEEIEAITCVDILRRASVEAHTAGLGGDKITGSHGVTIETDTEIDNISGHYDALVLPGGQPGADNLAASDEVKRLIKEFCSSGKIVAAICASPAVVLAPAGVLEGRKVTCYPGLEYKFPETVRYKDKKVVADGNIITSRGPATAMAFALKIVETFCGSDEAEKLSSALLF